MSSRLPVPHWQAVPPSHSHASSFNSPTIPTDVAVQQRWKWIRIHNVSLTRYMGKERDGGLRKLREELEAENRGVLIPAGIRWLGGAKVRARFQEKKDGPLRWWPQSRVRRCSTAFADTGSGSSESDTRSTFTRKCDQMPSAADAAAGDTSPHTARLQPQSAPSARRSTRRQTTDARSRGVRWEGVAHALMGWPSVPTVEDLTGRGRMPVPPRGGPGGGARGWRSPPPPRGERRAAEAPKGPEIEATVVQVDEMGEAEAAVEEEGGSVQTAMEVEE